MSKRKSSPSSEDDQPLAAEGNAVAAEAGYTVLARRYRPGQFSELVGQEAVGRALANALDSGRVAHAYLFTGARGVGKTSTARILAKALNCVQGTSSKPCGVCENCKAIAVGEDVDVLEIDGASNRGIDEVREIRQNVQYKPTRSQFKIYIVDEVHMLTGPAFNALLKTLEEPPPHVKFIFATTEVQKIPATILSRCQRFDFLGITSNEIVGRLRELVRGEGQEVEEAALEQIARRAGGSMRDAQSLLDQLLAFGSGNLTSEHVSQLLGTAHDDRVAEIAAAILTQDTKQALGLVGKVLDEGAQTGEFMDQMILYWRDLMVVTYTGSDEPSLTTPPRLRATLAEQARSLPIDSILAGLEILATTKWRLRSGGHPRTLIEMAVVRLSRLGELISLVQLAQQLAGNTPTPASKSAVQPKLAAPSPPNAFPDNEIKKKIVDEPTGNGAAQQAPLPETAEKIWPEIMRQAPPMLASYLQVANAPAIIGPKTLVLTFAPDYNDAREYCLSANSLARLEEILRRVAGPDWSIRIELGPQNGSQKPARNEERASGYRNHRALALKHPLVNAAIEKLDATMVEVDEGFGSAASEPPASPDAPTESQE
jgi:DNA polymerase-3 subunit gamma/tau